MWANDEMNLAAVLPRPKKRFRLGQDLARLERALLEDDDAEEEEEEGKDNEDDDENDENQQRKRKEKDEPLAPEADDGDARPPPQQSDAFTPTIPVVVEVEVEPTLLVEAVTDARPQLRAAQPPSPPPPQPHSPPRLEAVQEDA